MQTNEDLANDKRFLAQSYAEATEWNLATLSSLLMKKSSSKSEIRRQTSICLKMLVISDAYKNVVDFKSGPCRLCTRVQKLIEMADKLKSDACSAMTRTQELQAALNQWSEQQVC